jgi:hypothetical protein
MRECRDLEFFSCADAPIAKHHAAHTLYKFLCERIVDLDDVMGDQVGRCSDWYGLAKLLFKMVQIEMPNATGVTKKKKSWAYVWCVMRGLLVWQACCERVQKLSMKQVRQINVNGVKN